MAAFRVRGFGGERYRVYQTSGAGKTHEALLPRYGVFVTAWEPLWLGLKKSARKIFSFPATTTYTSIFLQPRIHLCPLDPDPDFPALIKRHLPPQFSSLFVIISNFVKCMHPPCQYHCSTLVLAASIRLMIPIMGFVEPNDIKLVVPGA